MPTAPGHFSALGMLMSDVRHDLVRTSLMGLAGDDAPARTAAIWDELEGEMLAAFARRADRRRATSGSCAAPTCATSARSTP